MWVRKCPNCNRELRKPNLRDALLCICGWVWG